MKILVACEYSGVVRDAFRQKGHDAYSCDLLPCDGDEKYHYRWNVLKILDEGWEMMIAHPPCVVVQRKSDNFALRLRDRLAFGKEVFLGMRELWITISQKCAGRPI